MTLPSQRPKIDLDDTVLGNISTENQIQARRKTPVPSSTVAVVSAAEA